MSCSGSARLAARLCEALHGEEALAVEALLKQGADPNLILPEGIAAIHLAAGKERESGVRCLKLILQYGGNPNARSVEELTPLHVAASWGCYKCLKLLLRNGGDPNLKDQDGNRAIDLALEQGNTMCVQILQIFQSACLLEKADEADEHTWSRNSESFLSTLTEDCTETSGLSRLSETCFDPGPLSSTQNCLPDGSSCHAGLNVTFNSMAAADASGCLNSILETLQDHLCHSVAPSTLAFCASSSRGHSQESATLSANGLFSRPGLPQPVLSSTQLSASNEPRELTSNLITTQCPPKDEGSAYFASGQEDSLAPSSPGSEDTTDSGHRLSSQPVPGQNESISKEPVIVSHQQCCSLSRAALMRRSVSFCESPKILPISTKGNWKESPFGPHCTPRASDTNGTLDLSQLSDFLDLEMLSKMNGQEGLDVTSPDHVYLFCRANSTAVCDLEKTMMDPAFLARTQKESDFPCTPVLLLSGSSESSSHQYVSCDSEGYISAAEMSDHAELRKCLERKDGLTGGETQHCSSSLHAGDENVNSNSPGSKDRSSQVQLHKRQMSSDVEQSLEELVEMQAAPRAAVGHLASSRSQDTEIAGGRHLRASSEASHVSWDGSGLAFAEKPVSEVRTCSTENKSLKDPGVSSQPQALQAQFVSSRNDRASGLLSTQGLRQLTLADVAVEGPGPQEAASSVNYRQVIVDGELCGKVREMGLSTDSSLSGRPEPTSNQWVSRKAGIPKWEPSANGSDPETLDTVLLGRAASGTLDTVLLDGEDNNREEEMNSNPFRGGSVKPPCLSSEADTLVIQCLTSPTEGAAEAEFSLLNEKQNTMMFPTKSFYSPPLQMFPRPCHVTPRTKSRLTSAARDNGNSSSLFDKTLEMPRRPRRVRSPQGMPWMPADPATCLEGGPTRGSQVAQGDKNASLWEGEETQVLDVTEIIAKATSCSGCSLDDNSYQEASPTVLLDSNSGARPSEFITDQSLPSNKGEAELGAACCCGLPLQPPSSDMTHSLSDSTWLTEDGESDCKDLMQQVAVSRPLNSTAFSQAESDAVNEERGRTLPSMHPDEEHQHPGQPSSSRVSFSRLSFRRPSRATSATDNLAGRLSPVPDLCGQDIPLSPGGRPVNLSTREPVEYLYMDEEEGHALIERHVPCMDDASILTDTTSSEDTIIYDWRAYQSKLVGQDTKENQPLQHKSPKVASQLHLLSDEALLRKLRNLGANPGPVTGLTRKLYLQLLDKLMKDPNAKARKRSAGHSPELSSALETFQIPDCKDDEMALTGQFDQPDKNRKWREGVLKSSFNYLLLDPRVTQNLPFRCHYLSQADCFRTFVHAIFYVGKGKRSRPYCHLYEALTHYKGGRKQACPKVQHILDIWAGGQGVISVHCFQNVIPVEAYTREACMVDAIGLKMLTNKKKGNYYGVVASWPMKRRRCLGIHMLHRAMQIFLAEGERQLRPADIQIGQ